MNVSIVRSLPETEWKQFVEQHPAGNIFHTPEMFQVFSRAKGHTPELWAALDNQKRIHSLFLPVTITLKNGPLRIFTTRSVVYGDLISYSGAEQKGYLKAVLQQYINHTRTPLFTEIRHQVDGSQFRETLCELSFNYEDHVNYLVDLALPIDKIWTNISKSTRKNIQKMLKNDLFVIEEIREVEKVKIWYQLMKNSFARLGVPLADYSLFETAFEILYPKGMIQFLLGKVQGEYMAASVALLYKDLIYGWYRGFNRDFSEFSPNEAMVWHLLKWGSENGFRYFDFGGAGNPHKEYGPRAFKQKFGGNLVNYGRSTFVHGPFRLKISQIGYKLFRNFL